MSSDFMAAVTTAVISEPPKRKYVTTSAFCPSMCSIDAYSIRGVERVTLFSPLHLPADFWEHQGRTLGSELNDTWSFRCSLALETPLSVSQISYLSLGPVPQLPEVSVAIRPVVKPPGSTARSQDNGCAQTKENASYKGKQKQFTTLASVRPRSPRRRRG